MWDLVAGGLGGLGWGMKAETAKSKLEEEEGLRGGEGGGIQICRKSREVQERRDLKIRKPFPSACSLAEAECQYLW